MVQLHQQQYAETSEVFGHDLRLCARYKSNRIATIISLDFSGSEKIDEAMRYLKKFKKNWLFSLEVLLASSCPMAQKKMFKLSAIL